MVRVNTTQNVAALIQIFLGRYVHHLTQDMKQLLSEAQVAIPLLSPARHGFCDTESLDPEAEKICGAYREQVKLGTAGNDILRNIGSSLKDIEQQELSRGLLQYCENFAKYC